MRPFSNSKLRALDNCLAETSDACCNASKTSQKYSSSLYISFNDLSFVNCVVRVLMAAKCGCRNKASATTFVFPGRYRTAKLNDCSISSHLAWRWDKLCCVFMY